MTQFHGHCGFILKMMLSFELVEGIYFPNLQRYVFLDKTKIRFDFGDLGPIFNVIGGFP